MTDLRNALLDALLENKLNSAKARTKFLQSRSRFAQPSREARQVARTCERLGIDMLTFEDRRFPVRLAAIPDPPLLLFVQGSIEAMNKDCVAFVGGREASGGGQRIATNLAEALANTGLVIVSGLAIGIDTAAHRGALNANAPTVAVLGSGHEHLYPQRNAPLARRIIDLGGAIVSEYPPHFCPTRFRFPERNRIVSGLALGVVVMEARAKSGSLITANYALEQGREVMAVPGPVTSHLSRGGHALIRDGAALIEGAEDVLSQLGIEHTAKSEQENTPQLEATEKRVLDALDFTANSLDTLVGRTGLSAQELLQILLRLELGGFVENGARGYIRAATR